MQDPLSGINLKGNRKKIFVKAPARVDFSGGTLDIWPIFCFFEKSRTINIAVDGFVELKLAERKSNFIIKEKEKVHFFKNLKEIMDSPFSIYGIVFSFFNLKGFEVEILNMPPRFSGLGGSSALLICLLKGIFFIFNKKVKNIYLISLGRDMEARNMGYPTGTQDFYPPIYGGALCINYNLGRETVERFNCINEIKKNLLIYNTKVKHHSGIQNFDVFKRAIEDKNSKVFKNLKEISKVTGEMYKQLKSRNIKKIGNLMIEEWGLRKELSPSFNHPEIDRAIDTGKKIGVWGYKPCGAAGGGSIAFLLPENLKEDLKKELNLLKGEVLPYNITGKGISIKYVYR